ncbi:uncharacterized protein DUF4440 [Roseivirga pacifica]|uniref:DUF4440 domain-containing protein n=1 Tax=Roseivirga pacifica TaxID=1267423 RepID=A0A1I0Q191_9BACT|nr:nuclear transport factor 2 family protein [Roseivirga pacifica]RKQ43343.1 uncharacterized protein DUF4440 [Roseivirga pacifica]SEW20645.1 protein of unknown function [Roseivirga pacifica]
MIKENQLNKVLRIGVLLLFAAIVSVQESFAQNIPVQNEIIELSKNKWQLMADKDVEALDKLFDEQSVFVHMGGSWGKEQELGIIESGGIHYKKADVHEVSVEVINDTAILLNRITLLAVVGGNEVTNPFMVTEVYIKKGGDWKLGSLSFTRLMTP